MPETPGRVTVMLAKIVILHRLHGSAREIVHGLLVEHALPAHIGRWRILYFEFALLGHKCTAPVVAVRKLVTTEQHAGILDARRHGAKGIHAGIGDGDAA